MPGTPRSDYIAATNTVPDNIDKISRPAYAAPLERPCPAGPTRSRWKPLGSGKPWSPLKLVVTDLVANRVKDHPIIADCPRRGRDIFHTIKEHIHGPVVQFAVVVAAEQGAPRRSLKQCVIQEYGLDTRAEHAPRRVCRWRFNELDPVCGRDC